MKILEKLQEKYTRKRSYEAKGCTFEMTRDSDGTPKEFLIWFDYVNRSGTISTTPKISLSQSDIQGIGNFWLKEGLIGGDSE